MVMSIFINSLISPWQFDRLRQLLFASELEVELVSTNEKNTLSLVIGDRELYIIRGEQIVTKENLEVLVVGGQDNDFTKRSLKDILRHLEETPESLTILPWGVGKWLGKRGALIREIIVHGNRGEGSSFFLGDNGNRPSLWPLPKVFEAFGKKNVNLPGSDPLIFPRHATRVGSYGFRISIELDKEFPFGSLRRQIIATPDNIFGFGEPCSFHNFFYDQMSLQIQKRMPLFFRGNN